MHIQVALQCHYFQKRLCWMLSSILDQKGVGSNKISVTTAHIYKNGKPTVEEVAQHFREIGMDIRLIGYPDHERFQYRGFTRNDQLEQCDSDWMLWADTDMVYPPDFFSEVFRLLETPEYKNNPHCLYSARFSTTLKETNQLVDSFNYPVVIPHPWDKVKDLPGALRRNIGAGYCHLVNVAVLKNSSQPYYNNPKKARDFPWIRFAKARSDMYFRRRIGGQPIPLPVQYHLQHVRDSDAGHHIDIQR